MRDIIDEIPSIDVLIARKRNYEDSLKTTVIVEEEFDENYISSFMLSFATEEFPG